MVNYNHTCILHRYGDMKPQYFVITTLTFWGHVTSSVTWHWTCNMVSYKWTIETIPLSRIVADILRVKHLATPIYHWKCSDHHFGA